MATEDPFLRLEAWTAGANMVTDDRIALETALKQVASQHKNQHQQQPPQQEGQQGQPDLQHQQAQQLKHEVCLERELGEKLQMGQQQQMQHPSNQQQEQKQQQLQQEHRQQMHEHKQQQQQEEWEHQWQQPIPQGITCPWCGLSGLTPAAFWLHQPLYHIYHDNLKGSCCICGKYVEGKGSLG